jgi:hypothetical protein
MGAWTTPEVKNLIIKNWLYLKNKGLKCTALEVRKFTLNDPLVKTKKYTNIPDIRVIQKIIKGAKEALKSISKSEDMIDEIWTPALLTKVNLPDNSVPKVVDVWKYSLCTFEKFTDRQAKWASVLYHFFDDITLLWFWSRVYANHELISIAVGEPNDTRISDSNAFFSHWGKKTLDATDYFYKIRYDWDNTLFLPIANDGEVIEELLHGINDPNMMIVKNLIKDEEEINQRDEELVDLIHDLPTLKALNFDFETKLVYLRFFNYILKGSKWNELSAQEAIDIIKQLRAWVISKKEEMQGNKKSRSEEKIDSFELDKENTIFIEGGIDEILDMPVMPAKLLKKVGYRVWTGGEE